MDFVITIQTWNGQWRYEVELEGEIVTNGVLDTFVQCCDKCKEFIEDEKSYYDQEASFIEEQIVTPSPLNRLGGLTRPQIKTCVLLYFSAS